jgi:hypothetical protein
MAAQTDTYTYSFTVDNLSLDSNTWSTGTSPVITTGTNTYTNMVSCTVQGCCCGGWHYYFPNYGWYWYPTAPVTKYLYQIFCPKPGCDGKFWAEIDQIKTCPKCKSKIKITDKESDYEVSVKK